MTNNVAEPISRLIERFMRLDRYMQAESGRIRRAQAAEARAAVRELERNR